MGYQVLVNESTFIERDGTRIWIAGTGDPAANDSSYRKSGAAPDIEKTIKNVPSDAFVIVLAHNPALWPKLAERRVDLTLSGHTHYGQFALSTFNWSLASLFLKHAMGIYREGSALLYINPGTNFWGIPLRFGTPPEITVLNLKAASHGDDANMVESDS